MNASVETVGDAVIWTTTNTNQRAGVDAMFDLLETVRSVA
jgi:hypothetical protein